MDLDLSSYELFLFDVDGTMAETEGLGHLPAFNAAFEQYLLPWRWDAQAYRELLKITGGFERLKAYRSSVEPVADGESLPSDALLKQLHLSKNQIYDSLMKEGKVTARPGLVNFINQISSHDKSWGIVTTTSYSNWSSLWRSVLQKEMHRPPVVVVCGEDVAKKKPDPEAYHLAMQKMGVPPDICLAIEDSDNGLMSARQAGLEVVVVKSQFFADGNFSGAKLITNEFSDLMPIF
jgi:HAD superfamily hydrolase (TIGR01509 family)